MAVAETLARAKSLGRDVRLLRRFAKGGLKGAKLAALKPGPGQVLDVVVNWHGRTVRIRNDDRPDKDWRHVRDKVLRPLTPPPVKLIARLFRRRRRRRR